MSLFYFQNYRFEGIMITSNRETPVMQNELTEFEELQGAYSDLFKDVYGWRPRNMTPTTVEGLREELDQLRAMLEVQMEEDRITEQEQVVATQARIDEIIALGAGDRKTALRWLADAEAFYSPLHVEMYVWSLGILHTDFGRALNNDLQEVATYQDFEEVA